MKKKPKLEVDPALIQEAVESVSKAEGGAEEEAVHDRLVRLAADFENFRKRAQKEKLDFTRYANEELAKALLPALDNFERALAHADGAPEGESIRKGVELILSQLQRTLEQFGVRSESGLGKPFDPLFQEAVSHVPSTDHPPHTVIEEHQKAYFLHDRLLRPAMVTVSRAPEEETAEETKE
jgi:molecular chaperone GrpE